MRILAIDTATPATAVALAGFGAMASEARDDPSPGERPRHATRLLPLAAQLLEQCEAEWRDIERVVVGTGPGTFTGLRIGIATARALAVSAGAGLVGVSTLGSLACAARSGRPIAEAPSRAVLAVLDARRGEVFAGAWRWGEGGEARPGEAARVLRPEDLAALAQRLGSSVVAVGDGALRFRGILERAGAHVPPDESDLHRVSARVHAEIARDLPDRDPERVRPDYLRLPDAELSRRSAQSR